MQFKKVMALIVLGKAAVNVKNDRTILKIL